MNEMQKTLRLFFLSVLALAFWAALIGGRGTALADEAFSKTSVIDVSPKGLNSFDIGFVDPKIGRYFLADRTNAAVDEVKTSDNSIKQIGAGAFVGVQKGSDTSGPNGVITANNHTEAWAADGVLCSGPCGATTPATQTSRVQVISLATGLVTKTIDTGGQRRADELCEDPEHHVVMVANDDVLDLFLTFIDTKTYKVTGKILLNGTDPKGMKINATNGIEQCQWSPRTEQFYLAVPEVNGGGDNSEPGVVLEISPTKRVVEKVFPIDFGFIAKSGSTPATADCLGPQGLAIGPSRQILLGCSNAGAGSVIINENSGKLTHNLPGLNGNDEVWYNPGDNHYFLAGSNHKGTTPISGPILGVVDSSGAQEDAAASTLSGSHSVAADPVKNQVYVPVNASGTLCGTLNGCIAVFTTKNDDRGICDHGEAGGKEFHDAVCPGRGEGGLD